MEEESKQNPDAELLRTVTSSTNRRQWPPKNYTAKDDLLPEEAMKYISRGVPMYKGVRKPFLNASDAYYALYASCQGGLEGGTDTADYFQSAFTAMTFQLQEPGIALQPWDTLEQPSLVFCYGKQPGTITLNHWVSLSGRLRHNVELRNPGIRPRDVEMETIVERLIELETSVEDDEDTLYKGLYRGFLKDPEKYLRPHKAMERQIADLLTVLSGPQWVDLSDPKNQIVTKFFANAKYSDEGQTKLFLYQVLLSIELDIRIHSKHHATEPKQRLLSALPPRIAWNLALARKWRETMEIEPRSKDGLTSAAIKFCLKGRRRQVRALHKFAKGLHWPNLADVDTVLRSKDKEIVPFEERSSDSMAYASGLILPGVTLPWLLMNSLIDCDKVAGEHLSALSHMYQYCGFQYRGTTYWSSACVVGKVLGPTCTEIAGWIGPARPAPDLNHIQIAKIRQRKSRQQISPKEVLSMGVRSDPLGPPAKTFPIVEYQLVLPDIDENNSIRIEKLCMKPVVNPALGGTKRSDNDNGSRLVPNLFDACIQFAINGNSWPLRLSFDVFFINAFPCSGGPHPIFYNYIYTAVKVEEVLKIANWGGLGTDNKSNAGNDGRGDAAKDGEGRQDDDELERVLVIEAFGIPDNEVLARAYCSHWGLSAVVAIVDETCLACAIREAYAACLNVVILIGRRDQHVVENG